MSWTSSIPQLKTLLHFQNKANIESDGSNANTGQTIHVPEKPQRKDDQDGAANQQRGPDFLRLLAQHLPYDLGSQVADDYEKRDASAQQKADDEELHQELARVAERVEGQELVVPPPGHDR